MTVGKALPFDTLNYARKLESSGVISEQAHMHASVLADVLEVNFLTKQETSMLISELSQEIRAFRTETPLEFKSICKEIAADRVKTASDFESTSSILRNEIRSSAIVFAQSALLISAAKLFH